MATDPVISDAVTVATRPPDRARSSVKMNAIANYLGRGWATVVGIICLPLFLHFLGREAYGLIGAFAVVQAWTLLLDFGLTPTLGREIVRARTGMRTWHSLVDLVRSVELLVVGLAALAVTVVWFMSPVLATLWLHPKELPIETVAGAMAIMGLLAAMRWMEQVYRGAIQGSEDQVWLNIVQAAVESARWLGALLVVRFVAADILWFFGWNILVSATSVALLRRRVTGFLREHAARPARPRLRELHNVRTFAGGMFLSSILAFLLTQADKLIVGSFVSLADFGIYALAGTAAAGLLQLVQPMNVAILPRLTALAEARDQTALRAGFRTAAEWLTLIVLPIAVTIAVLPERALLAWTGQPEVAASGASILSLLMFANLVNAMGNVPYMLQLAHGWTSLTNKVNAGVIVVLLPTMIWATRTFSGVGAAGVVTVLNVVSLMIVSWLVLSKLLPGEFSHWFVRTVLFPIVTALGIAGALRYTFPATLDRAHAIAQLCLAGASIGLPLMAFLPHPRATLFALVRRRH